MERIRVQEEDLSSKLLMEYKKTLIPMIRLSYPKLTDRQIDEALNFSMIKRGIDTPVTISNSYTGKEAEGTLLKTMEYIMAKEPIVTAYGVIYKKPNEGINPIAQMMEDFMVGRDEFKRKMFEQEVGSYLFNKFDLNQLLAKLDANALYGATGMCKSIFYNIYTAAGITAQGRLSISIAGLAFESFLANNVKFRHFDEVVEFINNTLSERRHYIDNEVLDNDIPLTTCFYKLAGTCGHGYTPSMDELNTLWNMMHNMTQQDINRLYYKNNLFKFMDNQSMQKVLIDLLSSLDEPYLNPNAVPKEIEGKLNQFWKVLEEYVFYNYTFTDSYERLNNLPRACVLIVDTDSNMVHLDPWFHYVMDKTSRIPMKIKYQDYDIFREKVSEMKFDREKVLDYDFYTDEVVEKDRLINPMMIVPQDGVRFSIINIMAFILTKVMEGSMERYTKNSHTWQEDRKCLMIMKNEFLFKSLLVTKSKRNYAKVTELKEGVLITKNQLGIAGLPINKSTLSEGTKDALRNILNEEIMMAGEIDRVQVYKELVLAEKAIINNIKEGGKDYFKPLSVKSMNSYDNPMSEMGVKAIYVWNALRDETEEAIDNSIRNNVMVVKVNINPSNHHKIKELSEDRYNKLLELYDIKQFKNGITTIALPLDKEVPEWMADFIDYESIVNDNLKNFQSILDCIGMETMGRKTVNYSNITKI